MARTGRPRKEFGKKDNSIHILLTDEEAKMIEKPLIKITLINLNLSEKV